MMPLVSEFAKLFGLFEANLIKIIDLRRIQIVKR